MVYLCQKRVPATWAVNLGRRHMQLKASCQDIVKAPKQERYQAYSAHL